MTHTSCDSENRPARAGGGVWLLPITVPALGLAALALVGADPHTLLSAVALAALLAAAIRHLASRSGARLGRASQVTLARAGLVAVLAAALFEPALYREQGWTIAGLALLVLALDGVDGWLARRFDECSEFGARFDMEVDAGLIMVLCLGAMAADLAGPWVLLIGLMRYGFLLAASVWPWLSAPLPGSFRRKLVCVWQVSALVLVITPLVGSPTASILLLSALVGLVLSFGLDVAWLKRHQASPLAT
ncbi:CDP-alcohol phosphatidyltransferase family protein [Wenzhouxiangella limi]|uniref:CDP-alcohol phosphatidyltransferase family protein n=1 Tax=Wenzhouxiangella limi TaxID=2707351 RepID=A0A845UVX1_9GAMM|nr:CDP-alcohol phosphatidyltransferase family protein [Wenzhouxiangella limi]NDY95617.1 CDP-alcohol phosphatidyltransferase family protein [Wenzhouxiangella limi]